MFFPEGGGKEALKKLMDITTHSINIAIIINSVNPNKKIIGDNVVNTDFRLINDIKNHASTTIPELKECITEGKWDFEHPLDCGILNKLKEIDIQESDDEYRLFQQVNIVKDIWKLSIEKSIKCLRLFDLREPFLSNKLKHPVAYGVDELRDYFDKYTDFEMMLYGAGKYYRDHVIHVFRVWLLGLQCLLSKNAEYLHKINVQYDAETNPFEKLSVWTIIAMTHDLGYPLEKSQEIIEKTESMMKSFISNPSINLNTSFDGVQNNMNDYILRFISSKMHPINNYTGKQCIPSLNVNSENYKKTQLPNYDDPRKYVARLQPKYYFKFQKSLEKYQHGILSSIIIYKILLYFLESDFSINEDYRFSAEDVRQYYIRREILRTISAHTCSDIYHLDMLTFGFLLIMVDDIQDWGRKRISELYINKNERYELKKAEPDFNADTIKHEGKDIDIYKFTVEDSVEFGTDDIETIKDTLERLKRQSDGYKRIFRDGQYTAKRNFSFEKRTDIIYRNKGKESVHIIVIMQVSNNTSPIFDVGIKAKKSKTKKIIKELDEYSFKILCDN